LKIKIETYKAPGTPGQIIEHPGEAANNTLTPEQQTEYHSGAGTLIQIVNKLVQN
jgi:hypothetical protein